MQINVTEKKIAACRPLNKARVAPIIVKFIMNMEALHGEESHGYEELVIHWTSL